METVKCEMCGKELPKSEATYIEDADIYFCPDCTKEEVVECERCGAKITRDSAYRGMYGYACECCHDELFD